MTQASCTLRLFRTIRRKIYSSQRKLSISAGLLQQKVFKGDAKPCNFDFVVVGGGILGLATARELLARNPYLKLAVVEKDCELTTHQSTRNPGLIHSGIYCTPGTQIQKLCVKGGQLLSEWCQHVCVPIKKTCKLIVATDKLETKRLDELFERACYMNIPGIKLLDGLCEIQRVEPNCEGCRAIRVPVGMVCWEAVAKSFADDIRSRGGRIYTGFRVDGFAKNYSGNECEKRKFPVSVFGHERSLNASFVTNLCVSLDRFAVMTGGNKCPMIFPMRAHYLRLKCSARHLIRGNIYPVPDPCLPFLGPHFTRWASDSSVCAGPNVMPASQREGYKITNLRDVWEMATYRGFWATRPSQFSIGTKGVMSHVNISKQIKRLQKYVPRIQPEHVLRGPVIVYPMAVTSEGEVFDDLLLEISGKDVPDRDLNYENTGED
ncbi:Putative fad-dependent oxidoreductase [Gryllus bimaculatus]|nr:Putative fad-dependent oxidoreductase [Gryllus bimaculatus]